MSNSALQLQQLFWATGHYYGAAVLGGAFCVEAEAAYNEPYRARPPGAFAIAIPLIGRDESVSLDLAAALTAVYDRARYGLSINYKACLQMPLVGPQSGWVVEQLGGG